MIGSRSSSSGMPWFRAASCNSSRSNIASRCYGIAKRDFRDARTAPRVDGDDAELVHARSEAAGVEPKADADRPGQSRSTWADLSARPAGSALPSTLPFGRIEDCLPVGDVIVAVSRVCMPRRVSSARGRCGRRRERRRWTGFCCVRLGPAGDVYVGSPQAPRGEQGEVERRARQDVGVPSTVRYAPSFCPVGSAGRRVPARARRPCRPSSNRERCLRGAGVV